jgi:hypothetical protein
VVTNLPLKAKLKWAQVVEAREPKEKIRLMQEFLSLCPKHKGTEKLLSQVKRRISQLKEELERSEIRRKGSRRGFFIEKSGAAQVVLLGPTKVGRSSLLGAVTKARPPIGEHPYITREPTPGMLPYQDIQFQIIEAPAIVPGAADGKGGGSQILGLARNADGLIIMVDLSQDAVDQYELVSSELEKGQILRQRPEGEAEVEKRIYGAGIQFIWEGFLVDCTANQVADLLREYRITSALVRVHGKVTDRSKRRDLRLGIVSHRYPILTEKSLRRHGLLEFFSCIVSPLEAEAPLGKLDPKMWDYALRKIGVKKEEAVYVGDEPESDIAGAKGAGLTPILVDRENRYQGIACLRVTDLRQLLEII